MCIRDSLFRGHKKSTSVMANELVAKNSNDISLSAFTRKFNLGYQRLNIRNDEAISCIELGKLLHYIGCLKESNDQRVKDLWNAVRSNLSKSGIYTALCDILTQPESKFHNDFRDFYIAYTETRISKSKPILGQDNVHYCKSGFTAQSTKNAVCTRGVTVRWEQRKL
eukprot:TRINITY_DN14028_c0_g1_i12.p1 TRINITY_DN14028_c0_g1~~TRINITY_DN14028_c0_g1_i12.p1  ORF type:complete len:167 (+),score=22.10 TRINITY_DN14028_c0_g1_i12:92-592(+)